MTGTEILSLVTGAYDVVKSVGLRIVDLFAMGKVDETEALKLKAEYEKAVLNFDFQLKQAGLWMQEKIVVLTGTTWIKPLALVSGFAIISVCIVNSVARSFGFGGYALEFSTPELLILLAMFVYVTSGSPELLIKVILWLIEKMKSKDGKVDKP